MPHQLRRVIAINIRNPYTGLPSGYISEMDPRGGVLAVGNNGVGKTTFLRLLPLFYGATPQQILRGSGRSSMIAHTLPDASCAVAYEYERETESDLRCVVMHCKPNEDAPQFHIIHSGFREEFVVDESNQFVQREDFKARVEAMGYKVERKLFLHQYRSVILNERLPTKEGVDLRKLAAVHSLGPTALYNLDQMAAAMANEKISFRDLNNIVIERVADSGGEASSLGTIREFKQSREAVSRWLEARQHLVDIMARKPDAQKITAMVGEVKGLHLRLCTLHVAVKQALQQLTHEIEGITTTQQQVVLDHNKRADHFGAEQLRLEGDLANVESALKLASAHVRNAETAQSHFRDLDIEQLVQLHDQEPTLSSHKVQLESELRQLEEAAGDVTSRAEARRTDINNATTTQLNSIGARREELLRMYAARSDELRDAEAKELDALMSPVRLQEITSLNLDLAREMGIIETLIANPAPSAGTKQEFEEAQAEFDRLEDAKGKTDVLTRSAAEARGRALTEHQTALQRLQDVQNGINAAQDRARELQGQLEPTEGTLLAFLRAQPQHLWGAGAKILNPALLERSDLDPELIEDAQDVAAMGQEHVALGTIQLRVGELAQPDWVDMQSVRQEIEKHGIVMEQLQQQLLQAQTNAKQTHGQLKASERAEQQAQANASLSTEALSNARANKSSLFERMKREEASAKEQAQVRQKDLKSQRDELAREAHSITEGVEADKLRIRNDFKQQRESIRIERSQAEGRLDVEVQTVNKRKADDLAQVETDQARELAGMGLDPKRVQNLQERIAELGIKLDRVAALRHEVKAWLQFKASILPTLESKRIERDRSKSRFDDLDQRLRSIKQELEQLGQSVTARLAELAIEQQTLDSGQRRLQELIERTLHKFQDWVTAPVETNWNVAELESDVRRCVHDLGAKSDMMHTAARALRNELSRHAGGPSDWLELKERELPDPQTLLEHQFLCEQAQIICSWFEPQEHGQYVNQLNKEMRAFMSLAGEFMRVLDGFERSVDSFNRKLQQALSQTAKFERFRDLTVTVRSGVGQLGYIKTLRQMKDVADSLQSTRFSYVVVERDLPSDTDANLIRAFRDILQGDGGFRVNLSDQVRLECSVVENGNRHVITNDDEFKAVSSNGNTALIIAIFLLGFIQMIRGAESPVRLTWVTDEVARFDPGNLEAFLQTLDQNKIDVISAAPSIDPALARLFSRQCIFESNGAILTSAVPTEEAQIELA